MNEETVASTWPVSNLTMQDVPAIITPRLIESYQVFAPTPEEMQEMIRWFKRRKNWTVRFVAALVGVDPRALTAIVRGDVQNGAVRRALWMLYALDTQPTALHDIFHIATYGKLGGCVTAKPVAEPDRIPLLGIFRPSSVWMNISWAMTDKQIAEQVKRGWYRVRQVREHLIDIPKQTLEWHWVSCGKDPALLTGLYQLRKSYRAKECRRRKVKRNLLRRGRQRLSTYNPYPNSKGRYRPGWRPPGYKAPITTPERSVALPITSEISSSISDQHSSAIS